MTLLQVELEKKIQTTRSKSFSSLNAECDK